MPTTTGEQAQAAQSGLAEVVASIVDAAFGDIDLADSQTVQALKAAMRAIIGKYAPASAVLAIHSYAKARAEAGVRERFTPRPAPLPAAEDIDAGVEWAARNALTVAGADVEQFKGDVAASAQKFVHDTGRRTVITNVHRDRQATAWARVPEPELTKTGTCFFCAMLCARGAVYKRDTVDFLAHMRHDGKGHNCVCHAEPVFGRYEPTARIRQWQSMWAEVTGPYSGARKRVAFRQAFEGRTVDGGPKRGSSSGRKNRPRSTDREPAVAPSPDEARRLIDLFEKSNRRAEGNAKLAGMVKANNARIAELRASL